jgi:hypothetical protein
LKTLSESVFKSIQKMRRRVNKKGAGVFCLAKNSAIFGDKGGALSIVKLPSIEHNL